MGSQGVVAEMWCLLLPRTGGHGFPRAAAADLMGDLIACTSQHTKSCRHKGFWLKSSTRKLTRKNFSILQVKSEFLSSFFACCVLISTPFSWQTIAIPNLYNKICCLLGPEVFL